MSSGVPWVRPPAAVGVPASLTATTAEVGLALLRARCSTGARGTEPAPTNRRAKAASA